MASNNRREITIVLSGDAKGLIGTVEVAEQAAKKLGVTLDSVSAKAKNAGKSVDDSSKLIESSNKRTAAAIGIVVGAAVIGFSALVKNQLNVADATGKMAQRLGVSTEFLSSMGYAAKSTGADSQVLASSLQSLAESQLKAAGGNKQFSAAFKAMGINFKDAHGALVPLAALLPAIAERFRTMPDGANKAALAAKLFGTEGTKLIPMLNQGKAGLAALSEEAASLGLVLDQQTTNKATALTDQLDRVKNMAAGAANAFLREMLPAVLQLGGGMGDAKKQGDAMAEMGTTLATAAKYLAIALYAVVGVVKAVAIAVAAAVKSMGIGLDTIDQNTDTFFTAAKKAMGQTLHFDVKGIFDTWSTAATTMTATASKGFSDLKNNAGLALGDINGLWTDLAAKKKQLFDDTDTNPTPGSASPSNKKDISSDWAARIGKVREAAKAALPDLTNLANMVERLQGKAGTPYDAADAQYSNSIRELASKAAAEITKSDDAVAKGHMSVAAAAQVEAIAQKLVSDGITAASAARDEAYVKIKRQLDISGRMIEQMQQEAKLAVLSPRDQAIAAAGQQYEIEYRTQNLHLTQQQRDADKQRVEEMAGATFDLQKMADQQNQVAQEYAGYWENSAGSISKAFGDLITGQTRSWKDFGRSLKSIAQQFISDLISQFARLRILGPLLSGAMGSAAGWLGITGSLSGSSLNYGSNYYGSGGTIGETASGVVGGSSAGGGGGTSYGGMLSNISTAKNAYTSLFGKQTAAASLYTNPATGLTVNLPGVTPQPYGGMIGNTGLSYAGAAGGLAGAYWGSQRGSGGISTAASTVTGAVGGYFAGTAAATALSGGIAAGMAAIPVVGWIALAAMLVDQVSGGKLFGTKYKTAAIDSTMSVGASGGDASVSLYQTRQSALFGGRKTRTVAQAVPAELQAAADALYSGVEKTMVSGAQQLGIDVPAMIEASLNTHVTLNDKGQVRATEYVVNYLGQTWKEATAEAASKRIGAEALVATVAASAGAVAQTIAQQWRQSADTLLDGAQTMLAAQVDINKGNSLVALGTTATLAQVVAFTQTMQADGEKLADTYNRLVQASASYLQFVGQFAPVSTGFGASLQAIAKQMQANIDQANALAQAAGLQHAREEDLANIHQFAAKQAADAIAQLSSAAQDLAAKLYNVTGNTLASVNAQIDKLQSKLQTAAQLAIGDNSPLSEKEKLDVALKGLRSGITSADDVLALGRKLYASSADYAGLYAKVQDILALPGADQPGTTGINSALDQYNQLIGQRDQYQSQADAMARYTDAKTLAQYVADISTTHGIGYGEAASGLGFSLPDLAKDLGVTNLAGYLDNLKLADIPGSTMDASASIVTAIQQLGRDLIQTITGGPITTAGITTGTSAPSTDPQVLALLASINTRLASIEGSTGATATTNQQMAKQGVTDDLRTVAGTRRGTLGTP